MATVLERRPMGRGGKGGRPPADAGERGTRQVRVFEDIAEMVSVLVRVLGGTSAQLIDRLVRPDLEALCQEHQEAIAEIRAAEARVHAAQLALRRAEEEAAQKAVQKPPPKQPRGP